MSILEPMIKPAPTPAGNTIYSFSVPHSDPYLFWGAALSRASHGSAIYVLLVYGLRLRLR